MRALGVRGIGRQPQRRGGRGVGGLAVWCSDHPFAASQPVEKPTNLNWDFFISCFAQFVGFSLTLSHLDTFLRILFASRLVVSLG